MGLEKALSERLAAAFAAVAGEPVDPAVRRSQHADYQSDAALPLARRLGRPPRDIAAEVVRHADLGMLCGPVQVSGPGFLNLTVADDALSAMLSAISADRLLGATSPDRLETVVVDYSGPNAAKEMHVGHLRSTVIGDAAVRLLEWLGHRVIRANHLGDWGTPFGMLIEHLIDGGDPGRIGKLSMVDLDGFYRAARQKFDADPAFTDRARQRVVALQAGDADTLRLWRLLLSASQAHFLQVYGTLDVRLTGADFRGESGYHDRLGPVVAELDRLGLLRESDGAACVFPAGFTGRDGEPLPVIVRKTDGGYGYGATDLAAIRYRLVDLGATRLLYVVGLPQRQHFQMVFEVAREAGWLHEPARAEHVGFGSVLGPDGRMFRTRAGGTVKLADLLAETVSRAASLARQKNPDLDEATVAEVAWAVGVGAVKYADLSTSRVKDYVFDWQRMLSLDGNTAPYLLYAYARIRSIFLRAGAAGDSGGSAGAGDARTGGRRIVVADPAERALALELLAFGEVVDSVARTLEFHRLAGHLYTIATTFSGFYERCPVLTAAGPVRASRLALCDLTATVLRQGLDLLGISTVDRM